MKKFSELIEEATATPKISVTRKDSLGNIHNLWIRDGKVYLNNQAKMPINLSAVAFNSNANGTSAKVKVVQQIALAAKNSKDLAAKLNKAGIGHTDWKELK